MNTNTIFQLRTNYGSGDGHGHLLIQSSSDESDRVGIFETSSLSGEESRASVYLDSRQWAELAVFAAQRASELQSGNPEEHLLNADVLAWQGKNRAAALKKEADEVREYLTHLDERDPDEWFIVSHLDPEAVDYLFARGEIERREPKHKLFLEYRINKNFTP